MIHRNKIIAALESKVDLFTGFDREFNDEAALYDGKLAEFTSCDYEFVKARLASFAAPGAIPSAEFKAHKWMIKPFTEKWSNHEAARKWAYQALLGRPTFAADGSQ